MAMSCQMEGLVIRHVVGFSFPAEGCQLAVILKRCGQLATLFVFPVCLRKGWVKRNGHKGNC